MTAISFDPSVPPRRRRQDLDRAWLAYLEDGVEPGGVRPEIARSWHRAREAFAVDPTIRRAPRVLHPDELQARREGDATYRVAAPVIREFAERLALQAQVLAWFDARGWMLDVAGHPGVVEAVTEIAFRPGACWSEEAVGTNGPGTALEERRPVEVFASEHFVEAWQRWTCASAPVFGPDGRTPVGLVDLTGPWERYDARSLLLARAIARAITERLLAARNVRDEVIRHAFGQARASGEALIAVDAGGQVLRSNEQGQVVLGPTGTLPDGLWRQLGDRLGAVHPRDDHELDWGGLRVRAAPVIHDGSPVGAILRATPRGRLARSGREVVPTTVPSAGLEAILGHSPAIERARALAVAAARTPLHVLLTGETGTGKELFARAIHDESSRRDGPFLAVNCGAIPASLLEAELFGYEPGTFTGGRREGHPGKFEEASGGTILLDELGELAPAAQTALLRVLEGGEVMRLGAGLPRRVDVRVIAATNEDLRDLVAAGRFRADLLWRLDVLAIEVPPLRQRPDDVPLLAQAFLAQAALATGRTGLALADEALAALQGYEWPGNVRQLRNAVMRAAATAPADEIGLGDLPPPIRRAWSSPPPAEAGDQAERAGLEAALAEAGGNVARAAQRLGVSRMTLYRRMARLGVTPRRPRPPPATTARRG